MLSSVEHDKSFTTSGPYTYCSNFDFWHQFNGSQLGSGSLKVIQDRSAKIMV